MLDDTELGIALFVDGFAHSPARMKKLFLALDEGFHRLGIVPNRLGAGRVGISGKGKYKTYRGLRPRLLKSDFSDIEYFTLEYLPMGRSDESLKSWAAQAFVCYDQEIIELTDAIVWKVFMMVFPGDVGVSEHRVIEEMLTIARSAADEYGCITRMRRGAYPPFFDSDVGFGGEDRFRTMDESNNRYTWTRFGVWTRRLLRDTFPINFLDRSRLDLPIEGTTLEKWIRARPDERGTVEPFNRRVWMWRPVIERIPFIREPLFRAGILHWYGFFMIDDYTQRQVPAPPPGEWFRIPK
ncbi:MAG: hypothetical protein ACK4WH_14710, partial [Phycisphaerales bacterium]